MSRIDKKSLKILREALPLDAASKIQSRLGKYTIDYITRVLKGTRKNTAIIEAALEIAKETKEHLNLLKSQINELASK